MSTLEKNTVRAGIISAISAYVMWGIAPLYFKLIEHIHADEILVHRVVWSTILLLLIVVLTKRWPSFVNTISQPKVVFKLTISAAFLAVNWFVFILLSLINLTILIYVN